MIPRYEAVADHHSLNLSSRSMSLLQEYLLTPFWAGLSLGLLLTFYTWKGGFTARRFLRKEINRLESDSKELQQHLNTQLRINAEGAQSLENKLKDLQQQNENLRINLSTLQQKPGRSELRQLMIIENAIDLMREQAPGFAPAWEKARRQSETDYQSGESGLQKLVRKVLPAGNLATKTEQVSASSEAENS
jgi:hypothetical protein